MNRKLSLNFVGSLCALVGFLMLAGIPSSENTSNLELSAATTLPVIISSDFIGPADLNPEYISEVNSAAIFAGTTEELGTELWVSDGTDEGTKMLKDIVPGSGSSNPSFLTNYKSKVYFAVGQELWVSDGTENGTTLLSDVGSLVSTTDKLVAGIYKSKDLLFVAVGKNSYGSSTIFVSNGYHIQYVGVMQVGGSYGRSTFIPDDYNGFYSVSRNGSGLSDVIHFSANNWPSENFSITSIYGKANSYPCSEFYLHLLVAKAGTVTFLCAGNNGGFYFVDSNDTLTKLSSEESKKYSSLVQSKSLDSDISGVVQPLYYFKNGNSRYLHTGVGTYDYNSDGTLSSISANSWWPQNYTSLLDRVIRGNLYVYYSPYGNSQIYYQVDSNGKFIDISSTHKKFLPYIQALLSVNNFKAYEVSNKIYFNNGGNLEVKTLGQDQCPASNTKTLPGQCGCSIADTDSDKDGSADCIDLCPQDANKISPGQCGCGKKEDVIDEDEDGTINCLDYCPVNYIKVLPGVCGCEVSDLDTDNDGTADCNDNCLEDAKKIAPGQCGCGKVEDVADTDADGIINCLDECPADKLKVASGQCGCGKVEDALDNDGDGAINCLDLCPENAIKTDPGACGCNYEDNNSDSDSVIDCFDGCPYNSEKIESGQCGCSQEDSDSDNDGTADCVDLCPSDSSKVSPGVCGCNSSDSDNDGDGTLDCQDQCPSDAIKVSPGECGCNNKEIDTDADGALDCGPNKDLCPENKNKIAPGICGCGLDDLDADGDGLYSCQEECDLNAGKATQGQCGCSVKDIDSDSDGVASCLDACDNDANKLSEGICGCGVPDRDKDGDKVADCKDACPNDALKSKDGGICGCGIADADLNGNTTADCKDKIIKASLPNIKIKKSELLVKFTEVADGSYSYKFRFQYLRNNKLKWKTWKNKEGKKATVKFTIPEGAVKFQIKYSYKAPHIIATESEIKTSKF